MECRDILVKLREDKGLSQQELADRLPLGEGGSCAVLRSSQGAVEIV